MFLYSKYGRMSFMILFYYCHVIDCMRITDWVDGHSMDQTLLILAA